MTAISFVICSYLLSSIPFGLVIVYLFKKIDIRSIGSGNIGATNVYRAAGPVFAFLTFLLDGLKAFVPILLAKSWFHTNTYLVVAFVCLLGHIFSIFLNFKGGKGVATAFFIIFAINYAIAIPLITIWIGVFVIMRTSALSAISVCVTAPFISLAVSHDTTITMMIVTMSIIVLWRHKTNMKAMALKYGFH